MGDSPREWVRRVREGDSTAGAVFSDDRTYRYALWREWDDAKPVVAVVGLNPSTADAETDDPTVATCVRYARAWGYGALLLANLFAVRATDPAEMRAHDAPVGPETDRYLRAVAGAADRVVAAWGVHGTHRDRAAEVVALLDEPLSAITTTRDGHPGHPLYKSAALEPTRWRPPAEEDREAP